MDDALDFAEMLLDENISNQKRNEILKKLIHITKQYNIQFEKEILKKEQEIQELEKLLEKS